VDFPNTAVIRLSECCATLPLPSLRRLRCGTEHISKWRPLSGRSKLRFFAPCHCHPRPSFVASRCVRCRTAAWQNPSVQVVDHVSNLFYLRLGTYAFIPIPFSINQVEIRKLCYLLVVSRHLCGRTPGTPSAMLLRYPLRSSPARRFQSIVDVSEWPSQLRQMHQYRVPIGP
jgi:hypothetical protein